MILVVGATGRLGGLIARRLLAQSRPVRILVRRGSDHSEIVRAGAEPIFGDLRDRDSLQAACVGVRGIVTSANAVGRADPDTIESVDDQGNHNLVEAAVAAGAGRFVFVSALGAHPEHPKPLLAAKGRTEQRLRESGLPWTALQPNFYMDTWIPMIVGAPALAGRPVTLAGDGRRRHSMIAMADVAAYATAALEHPDAPGRTLPLGGPQPVTWHEVIDTFEAELGRPLTVHTVAPGDPLPDLPPFVSELAAALAGYDSPMDMAETSAICGVPPTTLAAYVRQFLHHAAARTSG